jgi:acyl-CoA synthetase (AMP-forming)/AMP-acid ligase II
MKFPETRYEAHYGGRIMRCFHERPANIDQIFREAVSRAPDHSALVLGDERLSYAKLDRRVTAIAANLLARGLVPGDRVALLLGNGFAFVEAILATSRAGLIAVPMNIRQRRPETEFMLNQCQAAALIYDTEQFENLPAKAAVPALRHAFVVGDGPGDRFNDLRRFEGKIDFAPVDEEDVFCILYTSGTPGRPKGAKLTHFGVIHSLLHFQHAFRLTGGDAAMLVVPASHVTGLVAILLAMIRVAGTTVIMPAFKARRFLEIAVAEKMSYTLMVPAMYNLCLLDPDFASFDLSAWKAAGFGGAPMPEATVTRLAAALPGLTLVNCYGSTETTSPATILPLGAIGAHPDSVGKVLPCADILIMDDDRREVPAGGSGELLIAGAMVVPGYWDNPEADRAAFLGGYWISGDLGSKDSDGYVKVFDRKKDMINRAGFKVYCIEVESVMSHHPAIVEAAVIGKPDPVLGERVHAFVYSEDRPADADEIKAWCGERLSDYKVPDTITFLRQPLPRNANGKVLKNALRDLLAG